MSTTLRRVAVSALTCGLALSLTACGSGREYTLPKEACGVPLNEKVLEPFLVDGEKFEVKGDSVIETGTETSGRCNLSVDDWFVVSFQVEKVDKIYDPMAPMEEFRFRNRAKIENLPFPGLGAVGDFNSMVSTACSGPTADYLVALVTINLKTGGDVAEHRKSIEAITFDFVPKVKKALDCTA
ncbi:hypothetical protein [Streptomyces sp. WMMC940]|uniref:hypothetical protein n=1 Tax=Streptomyces sp. WMMC940 TaxID=3015153 RepID=UPI0022B62D2A|nr:hypothetical protein [Streptomyces sp. WMMC940]MCZ7457644.1 hypothetical protein [Streptomyces sp. WMMC940]